MGDSTQSEVNKLTRFSDLKTIGKFEKFFGKDEIVMRVLCVWFCMCVTVWDMPCILYIQVVLKTELQ